MAVLSPDDIDAISRLLVKTLDFSDLEQFVLRATGDGLYDEYVDPNQAKRPMIVQLLNRAEQLGTTERILGVVYRQRPMRPDVRTAIAERFPSLVASTAAPEASFSMQQGGAPHPKAAQDAGPGFEKIVRPQLGIVDIAPWAAALDRMQRLVCRIDDDNGALGTGFLVGNSSVLTNWHVVQAAMNAGTVSSLKCRFDFAIPATGGVAQGRAVVLGPGGIIDSAPYAPAETTATPEMPAPTIDELDYALLDLAEPVGAGRGFISIPSGQVALAANDPLIIVQHPKGAPMKIAIDTQALLGPLNPGDRRLRYRTNTEGGSSGSPCFSMDWRLIGLHHYGDPDWVSPKYNQGIPIGLIRDRITARGHGQRLG